MIAGQQIKTARAFFDDFIGNAQILVGSTVVLREREAKNDSDPNWISFLVKSSDDALYMEHVADMRKRHPKIDWSDVKDREGQWRIIRAVKKS
jgi:hypothetical protein